MATKYILYVLYILCQPHAITYVCLRICGSSMTWPKTDLNVRVWFEVAVFGLQSRAQSSYKGLIHKVPARE